MHVARIGSNRLLYFLISFLIIRLCCVLIVRLRLDIFEREKERSEDAKHRVDKEDERKEKKLLILFSCGVFF